MKKIILALVAASVLGAPVAAAPFDRHGSVSHVTRTKQVVAERDSRKVVTTRTVVKAKPVQHRRWAEGQRFDSRYAYNYRVINNPRANRLYDAPRGYRWVQSGNDAVPVGIASGLIGAVLFSVLN